MTGIEVNSEAYFPKLREYCPRAEGLREYSRNFFDRLTCPLDIRGSVMNHYKADEIRLIKLANFCGRGLVARENRPMKSLNHDTRHL